jgi:hypothetical protein
MPELREEKLTSKQLLDLFGLPRSGEIEVKGWELQQAPGDFPVVLDEDMSRRGFEWAGWCLDWSGSIVENIPLFTLGVWLWIYTDPKDAYERACTF